MVSAIEAIGQTAQESKQSQFSTEDVVPVFLRSEESYALFEKPIVLKKTDLNGWLVMDNTILNDNVFDSTTRVLHSRTETPTTTLVKIVPPNDVFYEDFGNTHFIDTDNTTVTITEDAIIGNAGDELVSTWIVYDNKPYTKATFNFTNILEDPNDPFQFGLFPLSFPFVFDSGIFSIYVYTDETNDWVLLQQPSYTGNFTRFKYKFVFNEDSQINLKDSTNKRRNILIIQFS
ncbi:MAG: hypothetical protein DRN17_04725 [Thermoplasmata archaeon]|nr:MAG: hypothetical protein DRN17_04725 [Thermoplasmata archaeon]